MIFMRRSLPRRGIWWISQICLQREPFFRAMDPVTIDGKVYGIPNQVTNQYVFMYRQDIYDELGLTVPETFDDYFNQAVALKENGYYAGAFDPADSGCNEVFQNFIYMLGGQVLDSEGNVSRRRGKKLWN